MATNVPRPTFGPDGFVAPTDEAILAGRTADINEAFGGGVNPALETPQGQMASSDSAILSETNDLFVFFTNQVDPAHAEGRMQDAIARIYGLERLPAAPTVVQATLGGLVGAVIPEGSKAVATDGLIYESTEEAVIDATGFATGVPFACTTDGAIACPADSLNAIYQAVAGWDTINNPGDGVVGRSIETRAAFEARRLASVAANARGTLGAILGEVLRVPDVLDAYVTENDTDDPVSKQGYLLAPFSIYVAVVGGDEDAVAQAIWRKKPPGSAYNGNTVVVVEDTNEAYTPPFPSYNVQFEIPESLSILFKVEIVNSDLVPPDVEAQVQAAIVGAFAGEDGGPRARIAGNIYATRYVTPIANLGDWAVVSLIQVGSNNNPGAVITGSVSGNVLTVDNVFSGTLEIGQTLSGTGVLLPGTRITANAGGTGGIGTYFINGSLTIASGSMTLSLADLDEILLELNQVPTIVEPNIVVELV